MYKRIVLIACSVWWLTAALAHEVNVTKHISSADGLSNDFVISMAIDGQGYVWVATESGVNRIAGNTCQPMLTEPLAGLRIEALHWHDKSGTMLISTEQQLTVYHLASGSLRHLNSGDGLADAGITDIAAASDGGVWLVFGNGQVQHFDCTTFAVKNLKPKLSYPYGNRYAMDDGQGHLYIGHNQHGMTVVNIGNGTSKNYQQQKGNPHALPGNNVRCIYQDGSGNIWVGTDNGLALFHPRTGTFTKVTDATDDYDDNVYDIHQTADGKLWVATDIKGIKIVDNPRNLHYNHTQVNLSSLNARSIAEDEYGNIWVGNHSTGVDFISAEKPDFSLLDFTDAEQKRQPVYSITQDTERGLWMASAKELVLWQDGKIAGRWSNLNGIRREYAFPRCMMADHAGNVWVGIDDQGVYRFDKKAATGTGRSALFSYIPVMPGGMDIHSFAEDRHGRIWIGGEFGVYLYENGKAVRQEAISRIIHVPATCIMETAPYQLFIATLGDGIYSFNLRTGKSRHVTVNGGLPSNKINQTIRDGYGGLWLGTDNGLVHLDDPAGLKGISVYGKQQGLTDNHVLALQQDRDGRIWVSTYKGIACFDKNTGVFNNYNHLDIHHTGAFSLGAAATDDDGTICFGSTAGVCCFNPKQMGINKSLADIQIISCEAYNPANTNTDIQQLMPDEHRRVYTTYQNNTLRLTFTVRNYAQTEQVDYSYKMKGMDDNWYDIGNDHEVVFRSLRPGRYTFILRARLRSQDWTQAKSTQIEIVIAPPFWRTWWSYLLYALLLAAAVRYYTRVYKRKLKLRNALELEQREILQQQQLNEERLRFFTNITHELRTPLTLILGPIDDLMDDSQLPQQCRRRVAMIQKSAERLKSLISEILEFRKTQTQNRRLTVARDDIGKFVREIYINYKELNRNPKVRFECDIARDLPRVWFDSEVVTTILNNFLSNAIKYTEQGSITTSVQTAGGHLHIAVTDTGYGIKPEALPHIFERYYQAKDSHQASGTGIGLALVKALAELHEAQVSVESREGEGSCFTFSLEIENTYPNALHKEDAKESDKDKTSNELLAATNEEADAEEVRPLLLVVEDNADIRQYIADSFCDDFNILQAENGEAGVQMAKDYIPDIIVSDIMMPRLSGIQLTRQLKEDIRTSHIPIILLTAKTTDEDKEEGYDSGADSYLTKPFTAKLLACRIHNLLTMRRRLAEHITRNPAAATTIRPQTATPQLGRLDREFVDKLNGVIRDNIMRQDIDLPFVTDKMAMSHSTFYRKVKAITGMTATEYIRKFRLQYCYQLLESGGYNVSQAAAMTGFNQMGHFRETFKKEFGILPSEVMKKKTEHT
jgi:signal transduction histidine kinase/ligand-binding sensor domain-containing protein/DNA-binding NarL/FixJ family response regulator